MLGNISEQDRVLFCQCRTLGEEITHLLENIQPAAQINTLRQLLEQEIPPGARHRAQTLIDRAEQDQAHLTELQAEYDRLCVEAENAAQCIINRNLRRFVRLYCIDSLPFELVCNQSSFSVRTAYKYKSALSKPLSEGNDGRTHQASTNR